MLDEIAQYAFSFQLAVAILATVISLAMISGGVEPPQQITALMLPTTFIYSQVNNIVSSLPTNATTASVSWIWIAATLGSAVLQFLYTMLTGFMTLTIVISTVIPPPFTVLSAPVVAIGAFLQLCVWYYLLKKILAYIKPTAPIPT